MITKISGGIIMDPSSGKAGKGDLLLKDERIWQVFREEQGEKGAEARCGCAPEVFFGKPDRVINAQGCIVAPGLTDVHVHFRDPGFTWKEDLETGSRAAAKGGFTTVVCMANTSPVVDTPEVLKDIYERSRELPVHLLQASAVTKGLKGQSLVDMEAMALAGAACFTDDGIPLMNERVLLEAMERAKQLGLPVSLHEEDPLLINGPGVHPGEASRILGYGGAAPEAEEILTARDCVLALKTGARVNIQHISSARSVQIVRQAKKWGADVHAEATPHHFTLTERDVLKYGTNAKMNPPLRTEEDRMAIIEGIRDQTIEMIVTDHAPHSIAEKEKPISMAPSGIIGLETSLGLGIAQLVHKGYMTMMELLDRMSTRPMLLYGKKPVSIQAGEPADLVIFAEDEQWTAGYFESKSCNSPFTGWNLPGKIHYTICRGKVVYSL